MVPFSFIHAVIPVGRRLSDLLGNVLSLSLSLSVSVSVCACLCVVCVCGVCSIKCVWGVCVCVGDAGHLVKVVKCGGRGEDDNVIRMLLLCKIRPLIIGTDKTFLPANIPR